MADEHLNRERAEGFGARAERYERTRPSYAPRLIEWLSADGPGVAVDVGCGTGRVAALLLGAGWRVVGIEPDERMAAIASSHGVDVRVSTFEEWAPSPGGYDLVVSGTAWHWVDPRVGYDVAGSALRPGGSLAIFRNAYRYESPVAAAIEEVVERHGAPRLADCVPLGTADPGRIDVHASEIARRQDLFTSPVRRDFPHDRVLTMREWLEELTTHSPIAALDEHASTRLLDDLANSVSSCVGDTIRITHETNCVSARRR